MKDWDEPRDKGPPIDEREHNWKVKAKGKKRFIIECRYIGNHAWFDSWCEWHVHRRYTTEKQRDQALANLLRRTKISRWEYRREQNEQG